MLPVLVCLCLLAIDVSGYAQTLTFAANPQHTGRYDVPAQPLNQIHWSARIDYNNGAANSHYGAPLITPANTVLTPIRTNSGFLLNAFAGANGALKYSLPTGYLSPPHNWLPVYQPVIAATAAGLRLYYPGPGGTVFYLDDPDTDSPAAATQVCFYTDLDAYRSNAALFNSTVYLNTPITADTNGAIFFGYRVYTNGATPPFTSTNGGIARIDSAGQALFVTAAAAAADPAVSIVPHNCAPALSLDYSTVYLVVRNLTNNNYGYLLGLDSTNLATRYRVRLLASPIDAAQVLDESTASPTIGPDGDVFQGVWGHGGRGWLLHFNSDLSVRKTPGGFGWDHTAGIVPAEMLPWYTGPSPYLLFTKYNDYAGNGTGINRVALLETSLGQIDPVPAGHGITEKRELLSVIGCTPDAQGASVPYAVREWCINTAAVNPPSSSIFFPSEDGRIYRWNVALNALTETVILGTGLGEPYVPAAIGPDGQVYALNGGWLFALGGYSNVSVAVYSSAADLRNCVVGQPVTFTAVVTNLNASDPNPTGTVTFRDVTYRGLSRITNVLAANLELQNGVASVTTTNLSAGSNFLGNHFITASYSGDSNFASGSATLVQKVHAQPAVMTLSSSASAFDSSLTCTVQVRPQPPGTGTPTGLVSFWDGTGFLAQIPLNTNGAATFTVARPNVITNVLSAEYNSDTVFAAGRCSLLPFPAVLSAPALSTNAALQFLFSNVIGASFTALISGDPDLPATNWTELGPVREISPGLFQFTDPNAATNSQQYYRVRTR